MFASRWLNTQLFNLGFAESYTNVVRFKQRVDMTEDIDDILQSRAFEDSFTTFVADNVDYNIATLDGKGTFHGMGVIAAMTDKGHFIAKQPMRLHPKSYTKVNELVRRKGIPITSYDFPSKHKTALCHYLPIIYLLIWTICGMLQGYLVLQQSRGQTGMVSCRMSLKESIPHGPTLLCCPSSTLTPTMKHAYTPLSFL